MNAHPWRVILWLGSSFFLSIAPAQTVDLVRHSPFVPAPFIAVDAPTIAQGPLELRGVVKFEGCWNFSIHDRSRRYSAWVKLGEVGDDFVVKNFDVAQGVATVEYQGQVVKLALQDHPISGQNSAPAGIHPGLVMP